MDGNKNIKFNSIIKIIEGILIIIFIVSPLISITKQIFSIPKENNFILILYIIIIISIISLLLCVTYDILKYIGLLIDIETLNIYKKYGNKEEINKIINEIKENYNYVDATIYMDNKFILNKANHMMLMAFQDIIGITKRPIINKRSIGWEIILFDRYGDYIWFEYNIAPRRIEHKYSKKEIKEVIKKITFRCNNIKTGSFIKLLIYAKKNRIKQYNIEKINEYYMSNTEYYKNKLQEVLPKVGYTNYEKFKNEVYEIKNVKKNLEFKNEIEECEYLVKLLGYTSFEEFYNSNIEKY